MVDIGRITNVVVDLGGTRGARGTSIKLHHLQEGSGIMMSGTGTGIGTEIGIVLRGLQGVMMNETGTGNRTLLREGRETNILRLHPRGDTEITTKGIEKGIEMIGEEVQVRGVTDIEMTRKRRMPVEGEEEEIEITGTEDRLAHLPDTTPYLLDRPQQRRRTVMPLPFLLRMQYPVLPHLSLHPLQPPPTRRQQQQQQRKKRNA